jgi:hypothetical protein
MEASRTPRTALGAPASPRRNDFQRHGVRLGVEQDARLPTLELRAHLRDLLLEGILALTVIGAFAQHEGFDHPVQRLRGERLDRDDERVFPLASRDAWIFVGSRSGLQSRRTLLRRRRISI